jgi:serpin B
MREQTVEVFLPRFTMTKAYTLNSDLQALGITAAFQPGGLSSMSDAPDARELYISLVAHKAFVEVNEEGTEAAAATAIVAFRGAAVEPKPNPQFRADHSFLYFIQDRETGAILFMGRLNNPS